MRLDAYLVEQGLYASRARAQAAVKSGRVRIDGRTAAKPSQSVPSGAAVETDGEAHPWVSRGGVKLDAALRAFGVEPRERICLDLGASTGGFTDVLLRYGAAKVYAVDVGRDQLAETLRGEPRVVSLEGTHAKDLSRALMPVPIDIIVSDVSFISLKKALPPALALAAPAARLVALVKPQFELGPARIGKGGIVAGDPEDALREVVAWLPETGWTVSGSMESPIAGGDGNREFLIAGARP